MLGSVPRLTLNRLCSNSLNATGQAADEQRKLARLLYLKQEEERRHNYLLARNYRREARIEREHIVNELAKAGQDIYSYSSGYKALLDDMDRSYRENEYRIILGY